MTIEEIQELFKIDIRQRNQKRHICFLKWLLIDKELKKGLDMMDVAEDINIHYSQVCKNTKKLESVASGEVFLKVKQCFDTKDAKLFSTFDSKRTTPQAEKKSVKKWPVSEIISTLRKDNSHYLWNKIINEFTNSDYKEMKKLLVVLVLGVLFVGCTKDEITIKKECDCYVYKNMWYYSNNGKVVEEKEDFYSNNCDDDGKIIWPLSTGGYNMEWNRTVKCK